MHTPHIQCATLLFTAAGWLAALPARGDVTPHRLFSDHAVLQRDVKLPVWGTAADGERVTVEFAGQKVETVAKDGHFRVVLDPLPESAEGRTLTFTGRNTVTVCDVLVGEVWLCSGQSNMEASMGWLHKFSPDRTAALAAVTDSLVRIAGVPLCHVDEPATDVDLRWKPCDAESVVDFSAVATFFGRDLRKRLGVPVGLIGSYAGGTPAESWTDRETLRGDVAFARLFDDVANDDKTRPSCLYNGMIAPLAPYSIRGVIWYQGESNSEAPLLYRRLFPAMIGSWRKLWGQGDFPFLFVQIAPCRRWSPGLREAQLLSRQATPNTAMVVTTDVGDGEDSHPRKKEPVGARLALAARAMAYGETIEYSGPTFDSMAVEGNRAGLRFNHVGSGLVAGGDLRGFFIAGADGDFHPARAEIEGDMVAAWNDDVPVPAAVRYGWASVPDVNLFNREGLPASPFRTDVSDSFVFRTDFPESGAVDLLAGGATSGRVILAHGARWADGGVEVDTLSAPPDKGHTYLVIPPGAFPFEKGERYRISYEYLIRDVRKKWPFYHALQGGSADGRTDQFREPWQAEIGSPGQREFIVTITRPDARLELGVRQGAIRIEKLSVTKLRANPRAAEGSP